jgi:hypothetical protein
MTEGIIVSLVAVFLAGVIATLLYRIFSRLKELEETLIDEILDTQELVLDVYEEIRTSAENSEGVNSEDEQNKG